MGGSQRLIKKGPYLGCVRPPLHYYEIFNWEEKHIESCYFPPLNNSKLNFNRWNHWTSKSFPLMQRMLIPTRPAAICYVRDVVLIDYPWPSSEHGDDGTMSADPTSVGCLIKDPLRPSAPYKNPFKPMETLEKTMSSTPLKWDLDDEPRTLRLDQVPTVPFPSWIFSRSFIADQHFLSKLQYSSTIKGLKVTSRLKGQYRHDQQGMESEC